ncbi:hypothetical protein [Streptomyces sp. NPDC006668]
MTTFPEAADAPEPDDEAEDEDEDEDEGDGVTAGSAVVDVVPPTDGS